MQRDIRKLSELCGKGLKKGKRQNLAYKTLTAFTKLFSTL